ncbi:MAG: hypothetical protein RLW42_16270, partial [Gammaproteobacteria bacterium]
MIVISLANGVSDARVPAWPAGLLAWLVGLALVHGIPRFQQVQVALMCAGGLGALALAASRGEVHVLVPLVESNQAMLAMLATVSFLRIVTPDGERLETDLWDYTREGSPLTMRLPSEPGSYAVAYVWAKGGDRTIARADIEVGPADLAIDMAAELPAGSMTDVSWRGPDGDGDFLAFVAPGGTADAHGNRYAYTRDGAKLSMQAPGEPGTYEAVYVAGNDNTVMIRKPFKVVEAPATLAMTGEPVAGRPVDVSWTGPGGASDWIGFAPVGAPPSEYLGWATPDAPSVRLTVPASAGAYELRYVLSAADGTKVLTSVPVTVTEPVVRLEAPPEVAAGAELSVVAQ